VSSSPRRRAGHVLALGLVAAILPARADAASLDTPRPARGAPAASFGYDPDRGAFVRTSDGSWELNPYGMVQLRNITTLRDATPTSSTFDLRSAKIIFHGHIFHPSLTYHFQVNAGGGRMVAEDVYLRWDPASWLGLLAGQIEVTYNRQHITLEAYQQFVERSNVNAHFNLGRDIGVAAYLGTPSRRLELTLGVWNGSRQNVLNDDLSYLLTARLAWNPWGPIAFRESDVDHSPRPRLSIALAAAYNPLRIVAGAAATDPTITTRAITQAVLDSTLRYRGLSLTTETHLRHQIGPSGAAETDIGALVQAGFFLLPRHFELIARHGVILGKLATGEPAREISGGANYYFRGHRLKLQTDYGYLRSSAGATDHRFRVQLGFFL
jgi:hypothetical protein